MNHFLESDEEDNNKKNISWGAFHAKNVIHEDFDQPGISAMLPLFKDDSKSVAMISHTMTVILNAINFLNTQQIPVIAYDQPLFAIAKKVQWHWPSIFGEEKYVIMMGGLHIEMACWKMIGNLLESSGWSDVMSESHAFRSGVADSLIKVSNIERTKHAHQLSACALSQLLRRAWKNRTDHTVDDMNSWIKKRSIESAQFYF